MSFAWQSQATLTRYGTLGVKLRGSHEKLGGSCHHQLSRHAVSNCYPLRDFNPHTKLAGLADLADAVQGRDRSSSSELRTLDSIDARFHSIKTRFRVTSLLQLSKSFRGLSTTDSFSPGQKGMSQRSINR